MQPCIIGIKTLNLSAKNIAFILYFSLRQYLSVFLVLIKKNNLFVKKLLKKNITSKDMGLTAKKIFAFFLIFSSAVIYATPPPPVPNPRRDGPPPPPPDELPIDNYVYVLVAVALLLAFYCYRKNNIITLKK